MWQLSGPTLFAPIVRKAAEVARATVGSVPPKYTCLLILTDGAIMVRGAQASWGWWKDANRWADMQADRLDRVSEQLSPG